MKKILAILFLASVARADSVAISSFSSTAIIPSTMFSGKTITLLNPTTNVIYLTSFPEALNSQAQTKIDGFPLFPSLGVSSNTLTLGNFRGSLYGMAASAQSSQTITYLGGQ